MSGMKRVVGVAAVVLGLVAAIGAGSASAASWSMQSTPQPPETSSYAFSDIACHSETECVAVGNRGEDKPLIERWNGKEWNIETIALPEGKGRSLWGVECTESGICIAIGGYEAGGFRRPLELRSAAPGATWESHAMPIPAGGSETVVNGITCTSNTCWAVGRYVDGAGKKHFLMYRKYGGLVKEWQLVTVPDYEGPWGAVLDPELQDMSCSGAGPSYKCFAVGSYRLNILAQNTPVALFYNQTTWTKYEAPVPSGSTGASFDGVSCVSSTNCIATGTSKISSTSWLPMAQKWNGSEWSITPLPSPGEMNYGYLRDVSCPSESDCIAVGWYNAKATGISYTVAQRWNGSSWKLMETPNVKGAESTVLGGISCTAVEECSASGTTTTAGASKSIVMRYAF